MTTKFKTIRRFKHGADYANWGAGLGFSFSEKQIDDLRGLLGVSDARIISAVEDLVDFYAVNYNIRLSGPTVSDKRKQLLEVQEITEALKDRLGNSNHALLDKEAVSRGVDALSDLQNSTEQALGSLVDGRPKTLDIDIELAQNLHDVFKEESLNVPLTKGKDCMFAKVLQFVFGCLSRPVLDVREILKAVAP